MTIPKKIHYCWFGNGELSPLIQMCIKSWEEVLPEYEIIRWDESNSVLDCLYVQQAYQEKQWAFVSDYIRLKALCQEGGIYLDTDTLVLKSIDDLIDDSTIQFFLGFENEKAVNSTIIGSIPQHPVLLFSFEMYKSLDFNFEKKLLINDVLLQNLQKFNLEITNRTQVLNEGIKIFHSDFFSPLPVQFKHLNYQDFIKDFSYTVHLWNHSWADEFSSFWQNDFKTGFQKSLQRILKNPFRKLSYYKNLVYHFKRYFSYKFNDSKN